MFSGIVEDVGTLVSVRPRGNGRTLVIRTGLPLGPGPGQDQPGKRVKLGDSIAVLGACLTVERMDPAGDAGGTFEVAAGLETLERTTLGERRVGDRLHLERALRLGDRLDGHIVAGHVDGTGQVRTIDRQQESWVVWVQAPAELSRYIAEKGSICIDGISLTVNELRDESGGLAFRVNIIPFTARETAIAAYSAGHRVNLEVDLLARYLERLVQPAAGGTGDAAQARLSRERLVALGFGPPPRGGNSGAS